MLTWLKAHSKLDNALSKHKITMGELEATKVTPDTVQRAILKLKKEKSDGEALISDHLILAPTSFTKILAPVVTSTWTHACPVISVMLPLNRFRNAICHA